jgi:hypothetical protein
VLENFVLEVLNDMHYRFTGDLTVSRPSPRAREAQDRKFQRLGRREMGMRFTVAATTAIVLALAATTASAGVVISEDVVVTDNTGKQHKSEQTVMLQGNKQKIITPDRVIITDPDAGKIYVLAPAVKKLAQLTLPPVKQIAPILARQGMFVSYQKGSGSGKVAGYDCQNYSGIYNIGRAKLEATECVASAAAGAAEYVAFRKALADKLKGSPQEIKGETPDGIPVSSTFSISAVPFPIPADFPPDQAAKIRESDAKAKPYVTTAKVTKIEVKNLPADTFAVPAEYNQAATSPAAAASPSH